MAGHSNNTSCTLIERIVKMRAPVVVFTYNRYEEAVKTMDALSENLLAAETEVYVFSNASIPEKEGDDAAVNKVRDGLRKYADCFRSYHLIFREKNNGSNDNMMSGINEVVKKHGKVIVLEDDIVTAKCFLNFMNQALDEYDTNSDVFSICGYNPVSSESVLPGDSFSYDAFRSWGWGIWKDRWESFLSDEDTVSRIDLYKAHSEGLMYISTIRYDIIHRGHKDRRFMDYWLACKQMADRKTVIYSKKSLCDNIGLVENSETSSTYSGYRNDNFDINYANEHFELSQKKLDIESDYKYFLDFRWNEFAMSMYFEAQYNRDGLYSSMYYALSLLYSHGYDIDHYLKKHGIKKIGIYGWGEAGKLLYDICVKTSCEVSYVLDSRLINDCEVDVYTSYDDLPKTDVVIVTAIRDFLTIEERLHKKVFCPVVCMDDVIAECKVDLIDVGGSSK